MSRPQLASCLALAIAVVSGLGGLGDASESIDKDPLGAGRESVNLSPACRRQLQDIRNLFSGGMSVSVPEANMAVSVDYDAKLLPLVRKYLDSPHREVVIVACHLARGHLGHPLLVPKLTKLLEHRDRGVRVAAAFALHDIGIVDDHVARAAASRLPVADESDFELLSLIFVLGRYRGEEVGVVSALTDIVRNRLLYKPQPYIEAVRALSYPRGKSETAKAATTLVAILRGRFLAKGLQEKGDSASANSLRYEAALGLGQLGVATPEVLTALTETLDDVDNIVHEEGRVLPLTMSLPPPRLQYTLAGASAGALGRLGAPANCALPQLKELYQSRRITYADQICIVGAIARLDVKHDEMIGTLIDVAKNCPSGRYPPPALSSSWEMATHRHNRYAALQWLGRIGPRATAAADMLAEGLKSDDATFRYCSAEALWRIAKRPEAVETLAGLLSCPNPFLQRDAARMLGEIGPDARPALPKLRKALDDRSPFLRRAAMTAIVKILLPDEGVRPESDGEGRTGPR